MDTLLPVYSAIQKAIADAAPGAKTAEMNLQLIKYADTLKHLNCEVICEGIGINKSFRSEVLRIMKIAERLKAAGLDASRLWIKFFNTNRNSLCLPVLSCIPAVLHINPRLMITSMRIRNSNGRDDLLLPLTSLPEKLKKDGRARQSVWSQIDDIFVGNAGPADTSQWTISAGVFFRHYCPALWSSSDLSVTCLYLPGVCHQDWGAGFHVCPAGSAKSVPVFTWPYRGKLFRRWTGNALLPPRSLNTGCFCVRSKSVNCTLIGETSFTVLFCKHARPQCKNYRGGRDRLSR